MLRVSSTPRPVGILAVAAALALTLAGCTGGSTDAAGPAAGTGGPASAAFAPYVDATLKNDRLVEMADATGVSNAVLAFALADGGRCAPSWGGVRPLTDPTLLAAIGDLRARGGQIAVATGGANGPYLENACGSAGELATAYGQVLDATGTNQLDVDIEAEVPTDTVVQALAQVQAQRGTVVSLTLQVADQEQGLDEDALDIVRAADKAGLRFVVNAMIMNFPYQGSWRQAMVDALDATESQLHEVWPAASASEVDARLGFTVMIGRTDMGAVTTLDDARALADEAHTRGLDHARIWSLGRDNGGCPGSTTAAPDCSGVEQAPFAFTEMFRDVLSAPGTATTNEEDGS
jgi:chitinase